MANLNFAQILGLTGRRQSPLESIESGLQFGRNIDRHDAFLDQNRAALEQHDANMRFAQLRESEFIRQQQELLRKQQKEEQLAFQRQNVFSQIKLAVDDNGLLPFESATRIIADNPEFAKLVTGFLGTQDAIEKESSFRKGIAKDRVFSKFILTGDKDEFTEEMDELIEASENSNLADEAESLRSVKNKVLSGKTPNESKGVAQGFQAMNSWILSLVNPENMEKATKAQNALLQAPIERRKLSAEASTAETEAEFAPEMARGQIARDRLAAALSRARIKSLTREEKEAIGFDVQSSENLPGGLTKFNGTRGEVALKTAGGRIISGKEAEEAFREAEERGVLLQQRRAQGRQTGIEDAKDAQEMLELARTARRTILVVDRALNALGRDANVGPLQKFLPNVREASVELDQIRNEAGLEFINAADFGRVSDRDLEVALETAIPQNFGRGGLRGFLERKRDAHLKVLKSMQRYALFVKRGGSIAEYLSKNPMDRGLGFREKFLRGDSLSARGESNDAIIDRMYREFKGQ